MGVCKDCGGDAGPGFRRCPSCAEKTDARIGYHSQHPGAVVYGARSTAPRGVTRYHRRGAKLTRYLGRVALFVIPGLLVVGLLVT